MPLNPAALARAPAGGALPPRANAAAWRVAGRLCLVLGQQRAAQRCFWRAVRAGSGDDAQACAALAHIRAAGGAWRVARAWQRRAVAAAPGVAAHHYNLAFLLERAGADAPAEAAFRQALRLAPGLDLAWYGLGLVLRRQGRAAEALAAMAENTRLQPLSPHGWTELAGLHRELGQLEDAARVLAHLQTFEPKAARALDRSWSTAQPPVPEGAA